MQRETGEEENGAERGRLGETSTWPRLEASHDRRKLVLQRWGWKWVCGLGKGPARSVDDLVRTRKGLGGGREAPEEKE